MSLLPKKIISGDNDDGGGWQKGNEEDISFFHNCYCPSCQGSNGETTMLPTKVPMFREIIIMNLICKDCGFRNAEINFGGEIQLKGERIHLIVTNYDDLNRQMIKSDSATISIPQIQLEIPPITQRGSISTIEGILTRAADNLQAQQPSRLQLGDIDNFHRCRHVIEQLRRFSNHPEYTEGEDDEDTKNENDNGELKSIFPFDIIIDDPAGNSFIENLYAPLPDPNMTMERYFRSPTQDQALGLQPSQQAIEDGNIDDTNPLHKNVINTAAGAHLIETSHDMLPKISSLPNVPRTATDWSTTTTSVGRQEVLKFETICSHCYKTSETAMCVIDIPHFKEVIIMSMLCESCGYKSNEIKAGGAIPKYGTRITLRATQSSDLAREVLKSDTGGIRIPEIDLELDEGGLDGVYTTIEGLIQKMHDRLKSANPFGSGDAARKQHLTNDGTEFSDPSPTHTRYMEFLQKLRDMKDGKLFPFTLIIMDPLSNSFIGPIPNDAIALALQAEKDGNLKCYDDYVDVAMDIEEYERSHEQNEILGLNDMKTENYYQEEKGHDPDDTNQMQLKYYGTDAPEELPDRIRRPDIRGPDHPVAVGKGPVEGDNTIMGPGSVNHAVPSMVMRGKQVQPGTAMMAPVTSSSDPVPGTDASTVPMEHDNVVDVSLRNVLHDYERNDKMFMMNEEYDGPREGMIYKDGAQGLGYYQDIPLMELCRQDTTATI